LVDKYLLAPGSSIVLTNTG